MNTKSSHTGTDRHFWKQHGNPKDQVNYGAAGRRFTIGLAQINNSFSGQSYLPYSVGLLQAHLQSGLREPEGVEFLIPVFSRLRVDEAVDRLESADIVLFSTYVWNMKLSLAIAERLKQKKPWIRNIFGGPQIPDASHELLARHPFIDLLVHGEGEHAILILMEHRDNGHWKSTPGISYRDDGGQLRHNPRAPRIRALDSIPSPYLSGVFDPLLKEHPQQKWIALWETNRGCPFSCTFCDWGSATASKVFQFDLERLFREVDWFAEREIEFVFCCDANFGIFKRDLDIAEYVAASRRRTRFPRALSVQNTKNATERAYQVQKILSESGLNKGVTLSMQSLDETTLRNIRRSNISTDSYQELQRRFTRDRVETYSDLILGLPGETYDSFADGVSRLIENGQHNRIQFNNLTVLPNAPVADPASIEQHGIVTVESDIINIHGSLADCDDEIRERQMLVIATKDMPREQWVRVRAFSWMASLLHFDKVLQIPIILMHRLTGASYRQILEFFSEGDLAAQPLLNRVREFFENCARGIQKGGPEYVLSRKHLNIYWPADEYMLIELVAGSNIDSFYEECLARLKQCLGGDYASIWAALEDAVILSRSLLKVPFQSSDLTLHLRYNLWEWYQSELVGEAIPLEERPVAFTIDRSSASWLSWDDYCREVIWYGNKKGAYLYTQRENTPQIAGIY